MRNHLRENAEMQIFFYAKFSVGMPEQGKSFDDWVKNARPAGTGRA